MQDESAPIPPFNLAVASNGLVKVQRRISFTYDADKARPREIGGGLSP